MKNLKLLTLITLAIIAPGLNAADTLKPFVTDGCTMFVDGTISSPGLWRSCCVEHDLRYWYGGSDSEMDATDNHIRDCVERVAGASWAKVVYTGIRAGHYSPIKNKYQWSWGWNQKREKTPLTPEESTYVLGEIRALQNSEDVNVEDFIKRNFPNQTAL